MPRASGGSGARIDVDLAAVGQPHPEHEALEGPKNDADLSGHVVPVDVLRDDALLDVLHDAQLKIAVPVDVAGVEQHHDLAEGLVHEDLKEGVGLVQVDQQDRLVVVVVGDVMDSVAAGLEARVCARCRDAQ